MVFPFVLGHAKPEGASLAPPTTEEFLAYGLLPAQELPKAFTSTNLFGLVPLLKLKDATFVAKTSRSARYSIPHIGRHRRLLQVPNPLHYFRLCDEIATNWPVIESFLN